MKTTVTTSEIAKRLSQIKVPPLAEEALDAILIQEGIAFSTALDAIINEAQGWEKKQEYVAAVLTGVLPNTRNALQQVFGRIYTIPELIDISKEEGRAFRVAIRALIDQPNNCHDETSYLSRVLGGVSPVSRPVDGGQAAQPLRRPPQKEPSPRPVSEDRPRLAPTKPIFRSCHIYGRKGAICLSEDTVFSSGAPTVRFEGALSANGSFAWDRKETFQCTVGEMTLIAGLLFGHIDTLTMNGHGKKNEKTLKLQKQNNKVLITLMVRGGQTITVPAQDVDLVLPMGLILAQLKKSFPDLSDRMLEIIIRQTCLRRSEEVTTDNE